MDHEAPREPARRQADVEIAEGRGMSEEPRRRGDYAEERERGQQFDVL